MKTIKEQIKERKKLVMQVVGRGIDPLPQNIVHDIRVKYLKGKPMSVKKFSDTLDLASICKETGRNKIGASTINSILSFRKPYDK